MNFSELEQLMSSRGVNTLAEISRALSTTPQAVSNWKARNQVPHHIVAKLNQSSPPPVSNISMGQTQSPITHNPSPFYEEDTISFSDIFLTIAEQLKVIVLTTFISVFFTFTYVQFIKTPQFTSWATVLLPENKLGGLGDFSSLAPMFGINASLETSADLSSPSLYPELLRSRTFAEKILDKEFYLDKYGKKLPLLGILTHGDKPPKSGRDKLIVEAIAVLNEDYLAFEQDLTSPFSIIKVTAADPLFAKELADVVLAELESLNRYFKSETVNEKTTFIEGRISSVEGELEASEITLKNFNERNRQISSPALQLEQERLERDVEVQKGVYLTLKQQLELAKIEEVQETSVVQVLDKPAITFKPFNKNITLSLLVSIFFGVGLGIFLGFIRSYLDNNDMGERKKLRRIKHFINKKAKDIILDRRVCGIVCLLLLAGLPFYLGYESNNPIFLGRYSAKLMLVNTIYVLSLIFSGSLFIFLTRRMKN